MNLARLLRTDTAVSHSSPPVVSRTPAHEQAEQLLASLRRRRQELGERIDLMIGLSEEKQEASTAYAELSDEIRQVRTSLTVHRLKHLEATRKTFRPAQRAAARHALAALREAEAAVGEINAMLAELRRLGAANPDLQAKQVLPYLVLPLERLAREKGEAS